jgi:asparagine synthase (glutamine-hydrolysing)
MRREEHGTVCGVSRVISRNLTMEDIGRRLEGMGSMQRHRGPDDSGSRVFTLDGTSVGLGFVRLSILDLETGMQPIVSPEDGCAIVCNGQVTTTWN